MSFEEFKRLMALRQTAAVQDKAEAEKSTTREKVLLPDQEIRWFRTDPKRLATCPVCDAVVDADILHPQTGLCPICHEEALHR